MLPLRRHRLQLALVVQPRPLRFALFFHPPRLQVDHRHLFIRGRLHLLFLKLALRLNLHGLDFPRIRRSRLRTTLRRLSQLLLKHDNARIKSRLKEPSPILVAKERKNLLRYFLKIGAHSGGRPENLAKNVRPRRKILQLHGRIRRADAHVAPHRHAPVQQIIRDLIDPIALKQLRLLAGQRQHDRVALIRLQDMNQQLQRAIHERLSEQPQFIL